MMTSPELKDQLYKDNQVYYDLEHKLMSDKDLTPQQLQILDELTKVYAKDKDDQINYSDKELLEKLQKQVEKDLENIEDSAKVYQIQNNLIKKSPENAQFLANIPNQPEELFEAIKKNADNKPLMEKTCGLVSNMAYKNPPNKKLLAKKGVIDALEKAVDQDEPAKAVFHALSNNS